MAQVVWCFIFNDWPFYIHHQNLLFKTHKVLKLKSLSSYIVGWAVIIIMPAIRHMGPEGNRNIQPTAYMYLIMYNE